MKKKSKNFFCNNFGIRAEVIYRCFVLIDLINDYKKCLFHKKHHTVLLL